MATTPCNLLHLDSFISDVGLILGSEERVCPVACTYEHEPVCGRRCEYITFDNKCELNKANKCGANPRQ